MLVVHAPESYHARYSDYLAEILRSEGYADLVEMTQDALATEIPAQQDLIVLPRLAHSWDEIARLVQFVAQGGTLIAFQPDYQLTRRFGVEPTFAGALNARLRLNTRHPALGGLSAMPIDVVVPAVHWRLSQDAEPNAEQSAGQSEGGGVDILARLDTSDGHPAVVAVRHGAGTAIFFAYDLPYAVARLRQGNPENADLGLADCDDSNRGNELFVGQLDPEQLYLPQVDIHTAFLARIIDTWAPRPRLWYYPDPEQTSVQIMTSDEDWSTLEQWQSLIAGLAKRNATCTFFMVADSRIEKSWVDRWEEAGHVFSVHPALTEDYRRGMPAPPHHRRFMADMLRQNIARHHEEYKRPVRTIRQHRVRWLGYVECAQIQAELGVRMDCNFLSVKPYFIGFMTGSGRALPFVDTDGQLIPGYQLAAQWTEECLIHDSMSFSRRWPAAKAAEVACGLIRSAAQEFYTPVCFNSHPVSYHTYSSPLVDATWDQAVELNVPIVSADHWLDWTEARDGVVLERTETGYLLSTQAAIASLTLLLPPGLAGNVPGASTRQVSRWQTEYTAVELTNLTPGTSVALTVEAVES